MKLIKFKLRCLNSLFPFFPDTIDHLTLTFFDFLRANASNPFFQARKRTPNNKLLFLFHSGSSCLKKNRADAPLFKLSKFLCCTPKELTFLTFWRNEFKFSYYLCVQRVETEAGSAEEQPARDRLFALCRKGSRSPHTGGLFLYGNSHMPKKTYIRKKPARHASISGRYATNTSFGGSAVSARCFKQT